jgi:hypothetical protein
MTRHRRHDDPVRKPEAAQRLWLEETSGKPVYRSSILRHTVCVDPPSIRKVVPVMKSLIGLARKQTADAMSAG